MLSVLGIIIALALIVIALEKKEKGKVFEAYVFCFMAAGVLLISMSMLK